MYSNFKYGYTVNLEHPEQWNKTSGNALHTDVKFENTDNGTVFFVNIQDLGDKITLTAWDMYDMFVSKSKKQNMYAQYNLGVKIIKDDYDKVMYRGLKSLKITLDTEIESDELPIPMRIKQISYTFFVRQYCFTVTAKALDLLMKEDPNCFKKLFSYFGLIPTREDSKNGIIQ